MSGCLSGCHTLELMPRMLPAVSSSRLQMIQVGRVTFGLDPGLQSSRVEIALQSNSLPRFMSHLHFSAPPAMEHDPIASSWGYINLAKLPTIQSLPDAP